MSTVNELLKFVSTGVGTCDRCGHSPAVMATTSPPIQLVCTGCLTTEERFALDRQNRYQDRQKDWS